MSLLPLHPTERIRQSLRVADELDQVRVLATREHFGAGEITEELRVRAESFRAEAARIDQTYRDGDHD